MPLRITHIDYGLSFGGSVVSLAELVLGLRAVSDVQSTVMVCQPVDHVRHLYPHADLIQLTPRITYRQRAQLEQTITTNGVARRLGWPLRKGFATLDAVHERWLAREIAGKVAGRSIDLVHANNGWSFSAALAARHVGAACVTHFRGYERAGSSRGRSVPRFSEDVAACFGIAPAVSASVVASGVPAEKVFTVDNPVTIEKFVVSDEARQEVRTRYGFIPNDQVIGLFGRVIPFKGQLEFLQAIVPLFGDWPQLRVLIVGDEADVDVAGYGRAVREIASGPECRGRVVFAGYQENVAVHYAASDIVVHCSVHPEPFGRVVVEGMAAARPVVAMDEGGPTEIITHNNDGLLVAPRNAEAMRLALLRFRDEPLLAPRLADAARATATRRYSPEASARQFLAALPERLRP